MHAPRHLFAMSALILLIASILGCLGGGGGSGDTELYDYGEEEMAEILRSTQGSYSYDLPSEYEGGGELTFTIALDESISMSFYQADFPSRRRNTAHTSATFLGAGTQSTISGQLRNAGGQSRSFSAGLLSVDAQIDAFELEGAPVEIDLVWNTEDLPDTPENEKDQEGFPKMKLIALDGDMTDLRLCAFTWDGTGGEERKPCGSMPIRGSKSN